MYISSLRTAGFISTRYLPWYYCGTAAGVFFFITARVFIILLILQIRTDCAPVRRSFLFTPHFSNVPYFFRLH